MSRLDFTDCYGIDALGTAVLQPEVRSYRTDLSAIYTRDTYMYSNSRTLMHSNRTCVAATTKYTSVPSSWLSLAQTHWTRFDQPVRGIAIRWSVIVPTVFCSRDLTPVKGVIPQKIELFRAKWQMSYTIRQESYKFVFDLSSGKCALLKL